MPLSRVQATAAFALALAFSPVAHAQDGVAGLVIDSTCVEAPSSLEADQRALDAAVRDLNRGGFAALAPHVRTLRGIAANAPACFPEISRTGADITIRSEDSQDYLALSLMVSGTLAQQGESVTVRMAPNTYPVTFFLLAALEVEAHRYEASLPLLDRGLALQPNNQFLLFEKVAALMGLQRHRDSATLLQGMIDNPALALTLDRSRAFRGLGVNLIDLNELDAAEAALNESMRIEPNNPSTQNELEYIAELRRGGAQRDLDLTSAAGSPD